MTLPTPQEIETIKAIAQIVGKSSSYPHTQEDAFVAILHGHSLGIAPIPALSAISAVKGRPMIAASTQLGLAHRAGVSTRTTVHTAECCTVEFRRGDVLLGASTFTAADARRAKLGGNQWQSYPEAMLFARAVTQGVRRYCPEVLGSASAYDPEEISAGATDLEALDREADVQLMPAHDAEDAREAAAGVAPPAPPHPSAPDAQARALKHIGISVNAVATATTIDRTQIASRLRQAVGDPRDLSVEALDAIASRLDDVAHSPDPVRAFEEALVSLLVEV